ncbi:MAG: hypothetical protein Athens071425_109 [Parcubacteria group bacterium Athens0714_25]|nr:MAG: hypothetical protein Athens071425_109 [Parcubacteria group bacterium Athens0714_25]
MVSKSRKIVLIFIVLLMFVFFAFSYAQENGKDENEKPKELDYGNNLIIDSDLDGLTDLGEEQIFGTDKLNPDTDGDGIFDGVEVVNHSNPLNAISPMATEIITNNAKVVDREVPWAWYVVRASGFVSFALLWWVMFTGLAIRTPILKKIIEPEYSMSMHRWVSVQAIFFAMIHGAGLMFDKFMQFGFAEVFVPFVSDFKPELVALGIFGFYLMIILILTSYFRNHLSFGVWRFVHYFNIVLYAITVVHALLLGTDMQNEIVRNIFLAVNGVLAVLIVVNIAARIFHRAKKTGDTVEN